MSYQLKADFPNLFKRKSIAGYQQLEHKIAKAIGETGTSYLPETYIGRATYVPGEFNLIKSKS